MRVLVVSADRTGAAGHPQNIGDALLTDILVDALTARGHDARALDLGESDRVGGSARVRAGGLGGLSQAVRGADAVVLGGGTLFQDDQPDAVFSGLPRLCAATAGVSRLHRTRYAVFGVGVDPVRRRRARAALRFATSRRGTWVRDTASAERLHGIVGRRPRLAADVSLLGADALAGLSRPAAEREGVLIALNRTEAARLTRDDVEALARVHGPVRFVSMDQGEDADAAAVPADVRDVLDGLDTPAREWREVAAEIASARLVVASRMHAMYLAAMTGVDVAALAPTAKTRAFADEFRVPVVGAAGEATGVHAPADADRLRAARTRVDATFGEVLAWLES